MTRARVWDVHGLAVRILSFRVTHARGSESASCASGARGECRNLSLCISDTTAMAGVRSAVWAECSRESARRDGGGAMLRIRSRGSSSHGCSATEHHPIRSRVGAGRFREQPAVARSGHTRLVRRGLREDVNAVRSTRGFSQSWRGRCERVIRRKSLTRGSPIERDAPNKWPRSGQAKKFASRVREGRRRISRFS